MTPETFESVENLDNALENPTDPLLHPRTDSDTISEAEPKAMELDIKIEPELEIKIEPDLWPDETQIQPEPIRSVFNYRCLNGLISFNLEFAGLCLNMFVVKV